jgi:WD40 repeat protein
MDLTGRATCVTFSPNGRLLACGDTSQKVTVWDWAARKAVKSFSGHTNHIFGLSFGPDGRTLASASWAEVMVWDTQAKKPIRPLGGHGGTIWGLAFSPDGQRLAVAGGYKGKGEVRVLDSVLWDDDEGGER